LFPEYTDPEQNMQPWHLTLSSTTRHALFPSESLRREAVRAVVRVCGDELVQFCIVDEHVHVVVLCDRRRCGYLGRALKLALAPIAAVPMQPVYTGTIHGRNHMEEVHRYVLQQPAHHNLTGHPALWSGSCFLDLAGARWIPGLELRLQDVLPRVTLAKSCGHLCLPISHLGLAGQEEIRALGPKVLVAASASACTAAPELLGRRAETARARRAACVLARGAGIPTSEMSWALAIHPGSVRKLAGQAVEPEALDAVRRLVTLEQVVRLAPPFQLPDKSRGGRRGPVRAR